MVFSQDALYIVTTAKKGKEQVLKANVYRLTQSSQPNI